jgi:hypothetical protein
MPAAVERLIKAVFPRCVVCGSDADLILAHIIDQEAIRRPLVEGGLDQRLLDDWHAAKFHHPANITRHCEFCETKYTSGAITSATVLSGRDAALVHAGPGPFLDFVRKELQSTSPQHTPDGIAIVWALGQVSAAWERGQRETPEYFVIPRKAGDDEPHHHVRVPGGEYRTCSGALAECQASSTPWEWWK